MKTTSNPHREERKEVINKIASSDNPVFAERGKTRALNSALEDLEDSINKNSIESGKLSKIMIWLTCVVAVGTFLLAIIGGVDLYFRIKYTHETTNVSTELGK